jgi:hypothetical protein
MIATGRWEVSKHGKDWITRYSFAVRYITGATKFNGLFSIVQKR